MCGEDLVLVDQAARQLNGQGVVALGVLRDHPELPAADPARGIDLFHRDFGGGSALDAVAGPLLRQRHHEPNDDFVAERMRQRWQRQRAENTTEEDERSLHRVSSLRVGAPFRKRSAATSCPRHHLLPGRRVSAVAQPGVTGLARRHRRMLSVSRPRIPCGRKIITRMTMLPQTSQRQSARNWSAVERYVMMKAPSSGPDNTSMPPSTMYIAMSTLRLKSKLSYWMNTAWWAYRPPPTPATNAPAAKAVSFARVTSMPMASAAVSSSLTAAEAMGIDVTRAKLTAFRSEEHTSELQSQFHLVCRLLLEKKKKRSTLLSLRM